MDDKPMIPGSVPAAADKHPGYEIGKGFKVKPGEVIYLDNAPYVLEPTSEQLAFIAGFAAGRAEDLRTVEEAFKEWKGE